MSERPEITQKLSQLVAKRLDSQHMYWSAEVNFDEMTEKARRVDFVGFKPFTPDNIVEPTSVELGTFAFYEVKSSMADYKSGNGLTFYGDENYIVCIPEIADAIFDDDQIPWGVTAILCPDKTGTRLYPKWKIAQSRFNGGGAHRKRSASEILWAIVHAH